MILDSESPALTPAEQKIARELAAKVARARANATVTATQLYDPRCCPKSTTASIGVICEMPAKGTTGKRPYPLIGSLHHNAKLTEADVKRIRRSGESDYALAKELRVSRTAVRFARTGITWAHVRCER